jgi:uncharacterized protein (DUF433 family)
MTKEHPDSLERIVQDPKILVGKPTVRGTRIPVELVLAKLAHNPDLEELFADYPRLTVEDVKACLAYARGLVEKKDQAARRRVIAQQGPRPRTL